MNTSAKVDIISQIRNSRLVKILGSVTHDVFLGQPYYIHFTTETSATSLYIRVFLLFQRLSIPLSFYYYVKVSSQSYVTSSSNQFFSLICLANTFDLIILLLIVILFLNSNSFSLVVDLLLSKFFFYSIWIIRYKQLLINISKGAKKIPYMPTYNYSRSSLCYLADFYMIIWTDKCWHIAFVNTTLIIISSDFISETKARHLQFSFDDLNITLPRHNQVS